MSKATLLIGVLILALFTFGVVNLVQNYQTGNELDYYLLKETTEAAMTDAVDIGYYRLSGLLRIDKEKFVESFMRRFAQNVANNRYYRIGFYDINETPPKVSVKVDSATAASFNNETFEISNQIDAVLESKYKENPYIKDMIRAGKLDYTQIED
ncbi:MAG TPA: hypothetical protein IAC24_03740 [Candidatus Onthousia faecigallinarum]|nr:hypothetical protein [Candidatus Onthousia faecigallinarum]